MEMVFPYQMNETLKKAFKDYASATERVALELAAITLLDTLLNESEMFSEPDGILINLHNDARTKMFEFTINQTADEVSYKLEMQGKVNLRGSGEQTK